MTLSLVYSFLTRAWYSTQFCVVNQDGSMEGAQGVLRDAGPVSREEDGQHPGA